MFTQFPIKTIFLSFFIANMLFCMQSIANADAFEGTYAGVSLGYSKSSVDEGIAKWSQAGNIDYFGTRGKDSDGEGLIGGLNMGYDRRINNFVIGAEISASLLDTTAHGTSLTYDATLNIPADPVTSRTDLKSLITIKPKLGYVIDENTMVYGMVGVAQGRVSRTVGGTLGTTGDIFLDPGISSSTTRSMTGYTIGIGIEKNLTTQWSMKLELNYVDLGRNNFSTGGTTFAAPSTMVQGVRVSNSAASFGLSYRF